MSDPLKQLVNTDIILKSIAQFKFNTYTKKIQ